MARAVDFAACRNYKGRIDESVFSGCEVESVDVNRSDGFCLLGKTFDPAEVPIIDGVYIDEDGSASYNRFCTYEQFEWGLGCQFAGRIN